MDLKDMTFEQLVSEQAGQTLIELGKGTPMRSIVFGLMDLALRWKQEQDAAKHGCANAALIAAAPER